MSVNYFKALKAALTSQYNIIAMVGAGLFSLVSWNWIPALIAAGVEIGYLVIAPAIPWYRKRVALQLEERTHVRSQKELQSKLQQLPKDDQKRYYRMYRVCQNIRENYKRFNTTSRMFLDEVAGKLESLLQRYLNMLQSLAAYEAYLVSADPSEIDNKLKRLRSELESDPQRVRDIKEKQVEILEKRLEKIAKAREDAKVVRTQLETIEEFVLLLKEQSLTIKDPDELTGQIDSLMLEVEMTEETVREIESNFSQMFDRELEASRSPEKLQS